MKTSHVVLVGLAAALASAGVALAQEAANWIGAVPSHRSWERYDLSVGVTASQQPRRATRIEEEREVLHVPSHYGTLVQVTGDTDTAVLWYRDAEGALRNVVVQGPAKRWLKIQSVAVSRYETDLREEKR